MQYGSMKHLRYAHEVMQHAAEILDMESMVVEVHILVRC